MKDINSMMEIELTPHLAQKIVDRTIKILNRNINIRDKNGIIIASGNPERINTIHEMAMEPIKKEKALKVSKEEAKDLPGVEAGLDLPIYFNDKVIGAVGIQGEPQEVEEYSGLVKMTVELMLQQTCYLEQVQLKEQAEENFIKELLRKNLDKIMEDKAKLLGYNFNKLYSAFILQIDDLWSELLQNIDDISSVEWQLYKNKIKDKVHKFFYKCTNIKVSHLDEGKFVILREEDERKSKGELLKLGKELLQSLNNEFNFKCKIGIGTAQQGLVGIKDSFEEGLKALNLGIKFYPKREIYYIKGLMLESAVEDLSSEERQNLAKIFPLDEHFQQSLEVYFDTGLNITKTAQKLFLHRNSIVYRLERIEKITGLNPTNLRDAMQLKLALLCYRFEQLQDN
jgi:carbohydrate diacid regulator